MAENWERLQADLKSEDKELMKKQYNWDTDKILVEHIKEKNKNENTRYVG